MTQNELHLRILGKKKKFLFQHALIWAVGQILLYVYHEAIEIQPKVTSVEFSHLVDSVRIDATAKNFSSRHFAHPC